MPDLLAERVESYDLIEGAAEPLEQIIPGLGLPSIVVYVICAIFIISSHIDIALACVLDMALNGLIVWLSMWRRGRGLMVALSRRF